MYSFNIVLTELCNANCSHCYMNNNSTRKKKTLFKENIDIIIEKIPKNTRTVVLTGGEIFLVKDLLYYSINRIKKTNPNITIGLESNGIYLYNDVDNAKNELIKLKNLGVNFIRFSDDPFHMDGGVDLNKVRSLKNLENNQSPIIKYLVQDKAVPLGKAKDLSNEEKAISNCMNKKTSIDNPYLFIDIMGNVYTCAWKCVPSVGNILNDEFEKIVDNLSKKLNKLILSGEIENAISYLTKENIAKLRKLSKKNGQCSLCIKYLEGKKSL